MVNDFNFDIGLNLRGVFQVVFVFQYHCRRNFFNVVVFIALLDHFQSAELRHACSGPAHATLLSLCINIRLF